MIQNLEETGIISYDSAKLISCAVSDRSYQGINPEMKDFLRASLFKNLLLTQL